MSLVRLLSLSLLVTTFSTLSYGQSHVFTKKAAPGEILSRFGYASDPAFAFGDIDSDGDEDVIISGSNKFFLPRNYNDLNAIYLNDGTGAFQKKSSNCFKESKDVPMFLHDVDGDNDLDFIQAGILQGPSIALYLNDGSGSFKESDSVTFPTYTDYDVALGDINNDGIMDIVVSSSQFRAHIGDGNGGFTDTVLSQVDGLTNCALLIEDLNNDGLSDIIATGEFNGSNAFRYYEGQGNLNFNQVTTIIPGLTENPSLDLGDINNDGNLDIGIMGEDANRDPVTSIYINIPGSPFVKALIPNLLQLQEGDIHLVDFNGDGNLDIFATGVISFSTGRVCALQNNNPNWNFTSIDTDDMVNLLERGSSVFHDVNGDSFPELFLGGDMRDNSFKQSSVICQYLNHGNSEFYRTDGSHFWNEYVEYRVLGDFTGDGFLDILAGGDIPSGPEWIEAYKNDGSGNFGSVSTNLPLYRVSDVAAIDADGDNYEDIVCYHDWNNGPTIFLNSANGINFSQDAIYLDWSYEGGISVGDIDGDGDDDFTYMTQAGSSSPNVLNVMLNDGIGNFNKLTLSSPPQMPDVSETMFADFNDDGHIDLFFPKLKRLYHWDPSTSEFLRDTAFPTNAIAYSRGIPYTSIADFDQNGRFDIMIGFDGSNGTGGAFFDLILQDTSGVFTYDSTFTFAPSELATIDTADFDQDGDVDVVYVGSGPPHSAFLAMILENDGQGNFTEYPFHELTVMTNFSWFMDVDNDGDEDIMQFGMGYNRTRNIGEVHENHVCSPIQKDTVVSTCASSFKWDATGCEYTVSGEYSSQFINAQNCFEIYKIDLEIKGFEAVINQLGAALICTVDTFASYQWYDCSNGVFMPMVGDTAFTFYPVNNGSYALIAANAEGCLDTTDCLKIENISVKQYASNALDVSVYPNPTSSHIQVHGLNRNRSFELFDLQGRKILDGILMPDERSIDVSNFKNGIYLLKIISNDRSRSIKILKM